MPLSELAIRNAKAKPKPYKMSDGAGLYVLVKPTGSRLWRLDYRHNGKRKTLALGEYPIITLAAARSRRDDARREIANGVDPSLRRKLDRIAESAKAQNTFGAVADEYLERLRHEGRTEDTVAKNRWLLVTLAGPDLGTRPIADITPAEILNLLKRIERSGRIETANRLRSRISRVFRLAVSTLRAENDPTFALQGALRPVVTKSHAAIIDEKKFGALLRAIDGYDGWQAVRCALQFSALTAARPGEVRYAEWSHIDHVQRKWRIPAQRTKTRREHEIPLCRQAVAVLDEMWPLSGHGELVFPSVRSTKRALSDNAFNAALRRLGYTTDEQTAHGFRSSFSSILNERGHDPEIIEQALAHIDGTVRGIYNRATYWDRRVALMQTWGDLLDDFRVF